MKKCHLMLIPVSGCALLFFLMTAALAAQKNKPVFPRSAFPKVKAILCKDIEKEFCVYNKFFIEGVDLNGDKKPEWFFYGPSSECGAHGNCPLTILQESGAKWIVLFSDWGNSYGTEPLSTQHKGYRDLMISGDMGSFYWIKEKWIWNGARYENEPNSTTYYLSDGDKLIRVTKKQWDDCFKDGKNCP